MGYLCANFGLRIGLFDHRHFSGVVGDRFSNPKVASAYIVTLTVSRRRVDGTYPRLRGITAASALNGVRTACALTVGRSGGGLANVGCNLKLIPVRAVHCLPLLGRLSSEPLSSSFF